MKGLGLIFVFAVFAFGCNKAEDSSAGAGNSTSGTPAAGGYAAVQAVFDANCIKCHGENGKDGVDLRTYDSVMKGGKDGPIVVAGDPASSLIIKAVKGIDGIDRMPKMAGPLSEADIAKIEAWIKDGAKN